MSTLVLASASPRRRDLLAAAGIDVEVRPADVDETWHPPEAPQAYALRVASAKARAVPGPRVLAADTVVSLDDASLGKPRDADEARVMLRALSGREHHVYTAVVLREDDRERHRVVTTRVRFRSLSPRDLDWYIATGEPFDKAGGYGIQGHGGTLVDRLFGSYTNVVGLPLKETLALLAKSR